MNKDQSNGVSGTPNERYMFSIQCVKHTCYEYFASITFNLEVSDWQHSRETKATVMPNQQD